MLRVGLIDIGLDILPGVTWNELFFNQTGAFKKPFLFSIVGQNRNKGEILLVREYIVAL